MQSNSFAAFRIRTFQVVLFTYGATRLLYGGDELSEAQLRSKYLSLPIGFEANRGQADPSVRFLARSGKSTLLLTSTEAVLKLDRSLVRMKLVGGSQSPTLTPAEPQSGKSNYFLGNDSKRWVTDITRYGRIEYQRVYPGISLAFYGNGRNLEYDWVIAPGADPNRIRTRYEGVEHLRLDENGDLVLSTANGDLRHRKPLIYQEIGGKKIPVEGAFTLKGREVGFRVAHYDRGRPLTIDPVLAYAGYLGGSNTDQAYAIAVDSSGSAYVTGITNSVNFPLLNSIPNQSLHPQNICTHNYYNSSNPGYNIQESCFDIFVSKFRPDGSALVYSTYIGGTSTSGATVPGGTLDNGVSGIAVDANGNAFICGATETSDFPLVNPFQPILKGLGDPVLFELNAAGNSLVFSTYFGGSTSGYENVSAITLDSGGIYLIGLTASTDFPELHSLSPYTQPMYASGNGFVTKFKLDGSALLYSTFICKDCEPLSIDVDNVGTAYITGRAWVNGIPVVNAYQPALAPSSPNDAFVMALDSNGPVLLYSTYLGGSGNEVAKIIKVDRTSRIAYVGGISFGPGPFPVPSGGTSNRKVCPASDYYCTQSGDGFVAKLSAPGISQVNGVSHPPGDLLASTLIGGVHMPVTIVNSGQFATIYAASQGGQALSIFDKNLTQLFSPSIAGQPVGLASDILGNVYAAVSLPGGAGNTVQKYSPTGTLLQPFTLTGGASGPFGVAVDAVGNLYVSATNSNVIQKFAIDGTTINLATVPSPRGLAIYPSGVLYALSGAGAGALYEIRDLNTPNQTPPVAFTQDLANPQFLTFDNQGNLYVSNLGSGGTNGYVQMYTLTNGALATSTRFKSGLNGPKGIVFDFVSGTFYVSESLSNAIHTFSASGASNIYTTGLNNPAGLILTNAPGYAAPYETKVFGITLDSMGSVFVSGYTVCTDLPQVSSIQPTNNGGEDVFILKFDYNLSKTLFSTYFGGTGDDWAFAMATDTKDGIYVTGYTTQPKPPVDTSGFPRTTKFFQNNGHTGYNGGINDAFIIKLANADIAALPSSAPKQLSAPGVAFAASSETGHLKSHVGSGSGYSASWNPTFMNSTTANSGYGADNFRASMPCPPNASCACTSSSYSCTTQNGMLTATWTGELAAGGMLSVPVQIQFDNTVQYGTSVPLSMTATSDTNDPDPTNNTASAVFTPSPLVNITTGSNTPAGLKLTVDGNAVSAPFQGFLDSTLPQHTFCAMNQAAGGKLYVFVSWTDEANNYNKTFQPCLTVNLPNANTVNYDAAFSAASISLTTDLIWQNDSTRQVTVNYYGGASYQGWNWLNSAGVPGWHVVAVADFNRDGILDLVWQNDTTRQVTVNYYGGTGGASYQGWNWLNASGVPGWHVAAVADFNGDGFPDLVWQNDTTRQVTVNYYGGAGGATYQGWNWLNAAGVPGWHVVGAADFNGDGVPDLVWQNDSTRQVTVNYYGGTGGAAYQSWNWLNASGVPGWHIAGAADFNGDGVPDLVWQNDSTRQVTVNYYGGTGGASYQGWDWLNSGGVPGWSVVVP